MEALTPREREVLTLLARGLSDREIANCLQIVARTVRSHTHGLLAKLGANNRTHAVRVAQEQGIIDVAATLPDESMLILLRQVQYIRKQVEHLEAHIVGLMAHKDWGANGDNVHKSNN